MIKIISALMLISMLTTVSACSCIYLPTTQDKYDNAEVVFVGKVIDYQVLESAPPQYRATLEVKKYWKLNSSLISGNTVEMYTIGNTGANCGFDLKEEEYLVYGYVDENGKISTTSCSGTLLISEAQDEIKELDSIVEGNTPVKQNNKTLMEKFFSWLKKGIN